MHAVGEAELPTATVNVHVIRSMSPSSAEIVVDSTVYVPLPSGDAGRATMPAAGRPGSTPPVATVAPRVLSSTSRLLLPLMSSE